MPYGGALLITQPLVTDDVAGHAVRDGLFTKIGEIFKPEGATEVSLDVFTSTQPAATAG